ncbi:MAG: hypothetical protein ABJA81_04825 [Nocardioidaceae bacterium]
MEISWRPCTSAGGAVWNRLIARAEEVETSLDVDTNNPTGALGRYQRAGDRIEPRTRTATFQQVLQPR